VQELVEALSVRARRLLLADQGHTPILLGFDARQQLIGVVGVVGDDCRAALRTAAAMQLEAGAHALIVVAEAWLHTYGPGDAYARREGLVVVGACRQGVRVRCFAIQRAADGRITGTAAAEEPGRLRDASLLAGLSWPEESPPCGPRR
jgi:hypothetical protein